MKKIISIEKIIEIDKANYTAVFLFDDFKVKQFDFKKLQNDKYKNLILKQDAFKSMQAEADGIIFKHKTLKDDFGYYGIGGDTLYYKGKNITLHSNDLIRLIRKVKNISQKKLAEQLKVNVQEIRRAEQGKETDIKLISRIFSVLM